MIRTDSGTGAGEIEWRRPRDARAKADQVWPGVRGRPSFMQLFVPLVSLAVGSILVVGVVVAAFIALLALFL